MMMHNGRAGLALLVTIFALLGFSIFAFYGIEYLLDGNHLLAIGISLLGLFLLSICLYNMCKSKANRSKRSGLPIEISSIIIATIVLLVGSIPFTMFVTVIHHENEFVSSITETAKKVGTIDSCYQAYANHRIANYENFLKRKHYKSTDTRSKVNSLRRRLMPENMDSIYHERQDWIKSLDTVSIWNVSTAKNLHYIVMAGDDWCEQYRQRSSLFYEGEDSIPFDIDRSIIDSQMIYTNLRTPHLPDSTSLLVAAVCIIGILTTYFYIRRPRNRYSGHHR